MILFTKSISVTRVPWEQPNNTRGSHQGNFHLVYFVITVVRRSHKSVQGPSRSKLLYFVQTTCAGAQKLRICMLNQIDIRHIFSTSLHLGPKVKNWSCSHFAHTLALNALNFGQFLLFLTYFSIYTTDFFCFGCHR